MFSFLHGHEMEEELVETEAAHPPQVNSINLCSDKDPLEFASRLLDSAAQNISLTIRRQVWVGLGAEPGVVL